MGVLPDRRHGEPHDPGGQQHVEQLAHSAGRQGDGEQRERRLRDHDDAGRRLRARHIRGRHRLLRGRYQQVHMDGQDR